MQDSHSFDLTSLASGMGLDYYGQIRMVNYIRRQVGMVYPDYFNDSH